MKKYLLFAYENYYPSGGLNDLKETSDSLEALLTNVSSYEDYYIHIYDGDTFEAVWSNKYPTRLKELNVKVKVI